MSDDDKPARVNPGDFKPGNPYAFAPGQSGNPGGRKKKPPNLKDAADVGLRWFGLIAAGTHGEHSRAAMRAALREALLAGKALPPTESQQLLDDEVEVLFEKHFALVMTAYHGDKIDAGRIKVVIDLADREYGKAKQSVDLDGAIGGDFVVRIERRIVDPQLPTPPSTPPVVDEPGPAQTAPAKRW